MISQICHASVGGLYGRGVPVNVEFKVTPYKLVYLLGEEVDVNVRIYFDREPVGDEIGKEYLVKGDFTSGSKISALKKNRTSNSPRTTLEISESTFKENYIYLRNQSDEVNGNFRIFISEEITRIELYATSYTLGKVYFQDELQSNQITINREKVFYFGSRRCEYPGFLRTDLPQYNRGNRGNRDVHIAEPHDYQTCELRFGTNPEYRNPLKYLTNTDTEIRFQDGVELITVYCEDETVGVVNWDNKLAC